jgi:hypothetical protein
MHYETDKKISHRECAINQIKNLVSGMCYDGALKYTQKTNAPTPMMQNIGWSRTSRPNASAFHQKTKHYQ